MVLRASALVSYFVASIIVVMCATSEPAQSYCATQTYTARFGLRCQSQSMRKLCRAVPCSASRPGTLLAVDVFRFRRTAEQAPTVSRALTQVERDEDMPREGPLGFEGQKPLPCFQPWPCQQTRSHLSSAKDECGFVCKVYRIALVLSQVCGHLSEEI